MKIREWAFMIILLLGGGIAFYGIAKPLFPATILGAVILLGGFWWFAATYIYSDKYKSDEMIEREFIETLIAYCDYCKSLEALNVNAINAYRCFYDLLTKFRVEHPELFGGVTNAKMRF